ncbi:hypothetical protein GQ600_21640 [Phytophthora cactorum]|nr:hypothetical protein GQ600_21640 [Phytophthora cactorum]
MGSYLSLPTTPTSVDLKIGPDEAALDRRHRYLCRRNSRHVIGTLGCCSCRLRSRREWGRISVGVSTSALAQVLPLLLALPLQSLLPDPSRDSASLSLKYNDHLITDGYVSIAPVTSTNGANESVALAAGTCVRTTIVDEKTVTTDTLYMRPIFSGATDNSNIDHRSSSGLTSSPRDETVTGTTDSQQRPTTTTTTTVTTATTKTESKRRTDRFVLRQRHQHV